MVAIYECRCGRCLAIASPATQRPQQSLRCDGCGQEVELTVTRELSHDSRDICDDDWVPLADKRVA